jgi:F-type H+-transporting ATPase subunit epsilon
MGILPKHAPVLTTLKYGIIKVRKRAWKRFCTWPAGLPKCSPISSPSSRMRRRTSQEIDESRADAARKRAEEILARGVPADTDAYLAMEAALRRSNLRLDAVRRYRKGGSNIPGSENPNP